MKNALWSLWAVARALFLGIIGQPDGGTEPKARARKVSQRRRLEESPPSGPLQTLSTLVRTVLYAVTFQPDNESDPKKTGRRRRK